MGTSVFKLARSSLRHSAVVVLLTLAVAGVGLYSTWSLKRQLMPELSGNTVQVVLDYPGAAPELVQRQLTGPVEAAVVDLPDVVGVTSTAATGRSVSLVEFAAGTDLDWARQRLSSLVTGLAAGWPGQVTSQFSVPSADDRPDAQVAVLGLEVDPPDLGRVAQITRDLLLPLIGQLDQVRSVTLSGGVSSVVKLTLKPAAMAQYGVGADQILSVLRDFGLTTPAGPLNTGEQTVAVQVGSPITSLDELRAIPLRIIVPPPPATGSNRSSAAPNSAEPTVVTLEMVAETALEPAPTESRARLNGRPAVVLTVLKASSSDASELSGALTQVIREANPTLAASGLIAQLVFDQAPFLESSADWLSRQGLIGLAAGLLIVLIGLPSLRSSLVTLIALPTALLGGLVVLRLTGASLNIMTVTALAVAWGRLLNDTIVVLENIKRHLSYGRPKPAAIVTAVREVAGAITAPTVATVALVVPLAFLPGMAGQSLRPFAWTLTAALASSLLVALAVVPVLCHGLLKATVGPAAADSDRLRQQVEARRRAGWGQRLYAGALRPVLRHPVVTLLLAALALGGMAWSGRQLEIDPWGPDGRDTIQLTQVFPSDSSLPVQDAQAGRVEDALLQLSFVRTVQTTVGGTTNPTPVNPGGQPQASFSVTVRSEAAAEAPDLIRRALSGLSAQIAPVTVLEPAWRRVDSTVELTVRALDANSLAVGLGQVEAMAQGLDRAGAVTTRSTGSLDLIQVTIDRLKARAAGLTETQLADLVAAAVQPTRIGALASGNSVIDVLVALGRAPATVDDLIGLPVGNGALRLGDLATVETVLTPALITTDQGQRTATVRLDPALADWAVLIGQLDQALDQLRPDLPAGVTVTRSGGTFSPDSPLVEVGLLLLLALGLAHIVLAAALGGPFRPLTALLAIPCVAGGAGVGLLVSGAPLGSSALIGPLALIGLTLSNTMALIGAIDRSRLAGDDLDEAVLAGACQRLRPVLLTAGAIALTVSPLMVGLIGPSSTSLRPLPGATLGGLVASILFSLIVAPACHRLAARGQDRRRDRRRARQLRYAGADRSQPSGSDPSRSDRSDRPDGTEESTVVIRRQPRRSRSDDPASGQPARRPSAHLGWDQGSDRPTGPTGSTGPTGPTAPATAGRPPVGPRSPAAPTAFEPLDRLGGGLWTTPTDRLGTPDYYDRPERFGLGHSDSTPPPAASPPVVPAPSAPVSPSTGHIPSNAPGGSGWLAPTAWSDHPTPSWTGPVGSADLTGSAGWTSSAGPTDSAGSASSAGSVGSAGADQWHGPRPGDGSSYLEDWRSAGPPRSAPEPEN
ncbi:MAG: efflux RND transporter permease subunit [Propionibacteriaceae bacterium]|jgi:HAE1 family hydrophobic/amphiphilic exporter-1|nr:efflux RND transporter permease subunit [Propionibacteriaceae bacterium]